MRSYAHETLAEVYDEAVRSCGSCLIVPDLGRADRGVFICQDGYLHFVAGEIEFSEKNCVANCLRDLKELCADTVTTICPNEKIRRLVAAKIFKHLPKRLQPRVHIFIEDDLQNGVFAKWLSQWSVGARASAKDTKQKNKEVSHEHR